MNLSCRNNKQVEFDPELEVEEPSIFVPTPLDDLDFPDFDYNEIIERFKKGERIGAADLIDNYADDLEDWRTELREDQKSDIQIIIEDMKHMARAVRSKKIVDADELLSECMIIDKDIAAVLGTYNDNVFSLNEPTLLLEVLKIVIHNLNAIFPELTSDQVKIANQMIKNASPLLTGDAVKSDGWAKAVNEHIVNMEDWILDNIPDDNE